MANILRMETSTVRNAAQRLLETNDLIRSGVDALASQLNSIEWQGPARDQFISEFNSIRHSILNQVDAGNKLGHDLQAEVDQWEVTAEGGQFAVSIATRNSMTASSNFAFPAWASTSMKWLDRGGELIQGAAILAVLKNGDYFADQVKINGSRFYTKFIMGLEKNWRSVKSATLVNELASDSLKVTPWSSAFTLIKLGADVVPDWFKYTDTAHRGAAVAIDSGIAAVSLAASYQGMVTGASWGAALGSVVPGLGTGVGAVAGAVVGGIAAGWATDQVLTSPLPGFGQDIANNLLGPQPANVSFKDILIDKTADGINSSGEALGDQIYNLFLKNKN